MNNKGGELLGCMLSVLNVYNLENQAKKRKVRGAEKLRDKKTSPSLDKILPIEKRLVKCLLHKAQKTVLCSYRGPKNCG